MGSPSRNLEFGGGKERWMPRTVHEAGPSGSAHLPMTASSPSAQTLTRRGRRAQVWESQRGSGAVLGPPALAPLGDRPSEARRAGRLSSLCLYFTVRDGAHSSLLTLSMPQPRRPGFRLWALARKRLSPSRVSRGDGGVASANTVALLPITLAPVPGSLGSRGVEVLIGRIWERFGSGRLARVTHTIL